MEKELKPRPLDIESGKCEVTLNEEDARELRLFPGGWSNYSFIEER